MLVSSSRRTLFTKIAAVLVLIPAAIGQTRSGIVNGLQDFRLPNGLQFVVAERHQVPLISIHVRVKAGIADDPPGKAGTATLVERMFQMGSETYGSRNPAAEKAVLQTAEKQMDLWISATSKGNPFIGQEAEVKAKVALDEASTFTSHAFYKKSLEANTGAGFTATASADSTDFVFELASNRAEYWFRLFSDWIRHPSYRFFYPERNQMRDQVSDKQSRPNDLNSSGDFVRGAFGNQPYGNFAASSAGIERLRPADIDVWMKSAYSPSNVVIAIAGDVTIAEAKRLAEFYFGKLPAGTPPAAPKSAPLPRLAEVKRISISGEALPVAISAWYRPSMAHPDDSVFDVIYSMLALGRQGFLSKDAADSPGGRNFVVHAAYPGDRFQGLFLVELHMPPDMTFSSAEASIDAEMERFRKSITADEVERGKTALRSSLFAAMEQNSGMAGQLALAYTKFGSMKGLEAKLEKIAKVSLEDVRRVVEKDLDPNRRFIVELGREGLYLIGGGE